jgi:hypothetical protein
MGLIAHSAEAHERRRRAPANDRGTSNSSITITRGFALFSIHPSEHTVTSWPKLRSQCLARLARDGVSIEMVQLTAQGMRFVVTQGHIKATEGALRDARFAWRRFPDCAIVSSFGSDIRKTAGILYQMLTGLAASRIEVLHCTDSALTISFLVPDVSALEVERFLRGVIAKSITAPASPSIRLDADLCKAFVDGKELRLGFRQARLLELLLRNAGSVVKLEAAASYLFGSGGKEEISAVRVHMHNLRRKLELIPENPRFLITVPTQGYIFVS